MGGKIIKDKAASEITSQISCQMQQTIKYNISWANN